METVTNVEKEIEVKIEQGREQLVSLKNLAYDKYCEAWTAMEQVKETTYETLSSAWEQAWVAYSAVVKQLKDYGHTAIDTASAEYELAKTNLAERTKDLQNWVVENGHKLKEESSEIQIETAHKLHQARKDAYEKYIQSKDALKSMFYTSQEDAKEALKSAEEQVQKTSRSLEKHVESAVDKTGDEFQNTKLRLEEAKLKAQKEFEEAKANMETISGKVSSWSQEVVKVLSEQSEFLSQRVVQMKDQLYDVASQSKEKVEETTGAAGKAVSDKWEQIYNTLKEDAQIAMDKLTQVKDSVQESLEGALVAAGITESLVTPPPARSEKIAAEQTQVEPPVSPINVPLA
jgi:hypothetical protein